MSSLFTLYCFYSMASRPKRRRRNPPTELTSEAPSVSTNQQVEDLVHSCVTNLLPTVEATCRQIILAHLQNTSTPPANVTSTSVSSSDIIQPPTQSSLLQEITDSGTISFAVLEVTSPSNPVPLPSSSALLTLGVDDKIRAKIHAGEYVKFSSLLPTEPSIPNQSNYKSFDKDGQLIFIKTNDKDPIKTIAKWTEAFHIFVAIFAEKNPGEIGNLMLYAHTVQKIAESCGDQAALQYDDKFRRWRQRDPSACPWQHKNVELYQEAVVLGLEFKQKNKN